MMRIVLMPLGSAGDVLPFVWLGRRLRDRGHQVVMITASPFRPAAERSGFEFLPLDEEGEYEKTIQDPAFWRLFTGTSRVFEYVGRATETMVSRVEGLIDDQGRRPDLMLTSCMGYGARLVRERHGIPLVNVHLQPAVMASAHEPPVLFPGMEGFRRWPLWLKRGLLRGPNPADWFAGPHVRRACRRHGVEPPRSVFWQWSHSPDGVLAMFPEWFATPQPDWPDPLMQWDFPLEDLTDQQGLDENLSRFLADGAEPLVFTPGSANVHARRFFEVAVEATERLDQRAVFVTRDPSQVPVKSGGRFFVASWAPFSGLLKRAAVFVHHGGVGTMSQGFAAGIPQLVMPMAHDQPDNAWRLRRLGAGDSVRPGRFRTGTVVRSLANLLENEEVRAAARGCATRCLNRAPIEPVLEWLEGRGTSGAP